MAFESIIDALSEQGYVIVPDFLDKTLTKQLYQRITTFPDSVFKPAKIGRQQDAQQLETTRNDKTVWLSEDNLIEQAYLTEMTQLKTALNQQLYFGLRDFEAHFAHYPVGHFYQRHVDAFRGQSNRVVSSVFYLNPNWQAEDGGELVIYNADEAEQAITVSPQFGQLVLFLSEQFPHEVLAANRDRYSIAGWFRQDGLL